MPIPDIKDAGIVAGFGLWGWPYHGLCSAGVIACVGGISKTIVTPEHGSAWLYDLGLPAIARTPAEITADTALGHEWRNYTMISGGVINGTQIKPIGSDAFVHVDESGVPWLIRMAYTYPNLVSQQVRITFSVVRFGLFGEGVKTPVQVVKDVQCHYITYSMYTYTYQGYETMLEDVWTNGEKALVSVGRTRSSSPAFKDLFSLLEVTFSGSGGSDGSGLTINVAEIRADTQLSQGLPGQDSPLTIRSISGDSFAWTGSHPVWNPTWANPNIFWNDQGAGAPPGGIGALDKKYLDTYTYARYAYYNASGQARVARIMKKFETNTTFISASHGTTGQLTANNTNCFGETVVDTYYHNTAYLTSDVTCRDDWSFGVYLLEDDTVIDSLELSQSNTITQHFLVDNYTTWPVSGTTLFCDEQVFPPGAWGTVGGGFYTDAATTNESVSAPAWGGSLATSLALPAPPDLRDPGGWFFDVSTGLDTEPLHVDDLILKWRAMNTNYETSGTAVVAGTASLGIQRIDAKCAAFYAPGTTRAYGNILTPLGIKTTSMTPAGNLYFAWQRKTADFVFDTTPICFV